MSHCQHSDMQDGSTWLLLHSCRHLLLTCVVFFFFFSLSSFLCCGFTRAGCVLYACLLQLSHLSSHPHLFRLGFVPRYRPQSPQNHLDVAQQGAPAPSPAAGCLRPPPQAPGPLEVPHAGAGPRNLAAFSQPPASVCHEQFGAGNKEAAAFFFQAKGAAVWGQGMLRRQVRSSG